jgi:hypothetical protein
MRLSTYLSISLVVLSGTCLQGRGTKLADDTAAAVGSSINVPVTPVVPLPVESFDKPESYFLMFDGLKAFAEPSLVRVKDVERLQKDIVGKINRKLDEVLKKNDSAGAVKQYLSKNQKSVDAEARVAKVKEVYKTKKDAYCAKEKKPEFRALEAGALSDSSQRNAFMALLKKAGLKDEWEEIQAASKELTEAVKARNDAWKNLPPALQNLVRIYQNKLSEVEKAAAKKIAQIQA